MQRQQKSCLLAEVFTILPHRSIYRCFIEQNRLDSPSTLSILCSMGPQKIPFTASSLVMGLRGSAGPSSIQLLHNPIVSMDYDHPIYIMGLSVAWDRPSGAVLTVLKKVTFQHSTWFSSRFRISVVLFPMTSVFLTWSMDLPWLLCPCLCPGCSDLGPPAPIHFSPSRLTQHGTTSSDRFRRPARTRSKVH